MSAPRAARTRPPRRARTWAPGRGVLAAAAALALCAAALVAASATPASAALAARVGSAPTLSPDDVPLGALSASTPLDLDVQLQPRDPAALARDATDVSTPGSARFRHYLPRGRFASEFGPTPAALAAVMGWLRAKGLRVRSVSDNHLTVQVEAQAAAVERAFSTSLVRYRGPDGSVAFANTAAPLVGAAVVDDVQGIVGLDTLSVPQWLGVAPSGREHASPAVRGPQACATAVAQAKHLHAYTAEELASAYGFTSLYAAGDEGAGVTIGVFEQEDNLASDVATYQSCYGTDAAISDVQVDGGSPPQTNGEADEDLEVAIGLAPKAHVDVYQAPATLKGALDDYTAMVDRDTAQVLTTSWGQCESQTGASLLAAEASVFEQAAVQGQTVFSASGDSGSSGCSTKALADDDPASQSYVTGVGGTKLTAVGPPPAEIVWNESATSAGAGGGGISAYHVMPAYQRDAPASLHVVDSYSSGTPCHAPHGSYCREVPDVAADADYSTGYLTYYDGRWEANGGTSASAPLWAALAALADASKACGGKSIGFANPSLYDAAATSYAADFHDVTSGNNDDTNWGNTSGLYPAGTGYDMASGLGTPIAGALATSLCDDAHVTVVATSDTLSLSRRSVPYGREQTETFSVRVVGKPGDGRPVGAVVVFNVTKKLCSHEVTAATGDASVGRCSLGASALRAGTHPDVYAVFDPGVGSSSDAHVHYRSSRTKAASLVVTSTTG